MVGDEDERAGLKGRGVVDVDGSVRDEAGAISEEDEAEDISVEGGIWSGIANLIGDCDG